MKGIHIIVEANGAAYRANVVTELSTKQGVRTSAILGTLNIAHSTITGLSKMYQLPVKETIFAWDYGHSPRRKALFPEYKQGRVKKEWTPEDKQWMEEFYQQTDILHENLHIFGLKSYRKSHWEGDDLVWGFTYALNQKYPNDLVVIVSTDEDFHQLITPKVHVYSPIKKLLFTPENYQELMGISVENYLTYKILKGDSSDAIPGIAGIGDKTAKTIVNKYGSLQGILSNAEELCKSKRTAAIFTKAGLQTLDRNNKLINLKEYVDLTPIMSELKETLDSKPELDNNAARQFLMKYQLTSVLVKYREWSNVFDEMTANFAE